MRGAVLLALLLTGAAAQPETLRFGRFGDVRLVLAGMRVLCVYGKDETESVCRDLPPGLAIRDERPGNHHFAGDYAAIGARIAQELAR